ncbi:MAG: aminotransferase class I/II-fold pyridoxal phosphate-dependent enzyme [Myxococcales bacterium]|nr:aminotransferase class I/II-fold pyridoxal phosphate-dependent enzyme [Myxococcales bacterium]
MTAQKKRAQRITGAGAVQVAASIEASIRAGELAPGDPLPTVRELAGRLGLAPATVAAAYRALRARGLAVARGRRGTRVSPRPPIASAPPPAVPEHVRNLSLGNPDPRLLPDLAPFLATLARDGGPSRLYGEAVIHPDLERLARADFLADGIPCEAVGIASGALDAIERVLQAHLRPGDRVAVEDPGFTGVLDLVAALGLEAVPVAVDAEGPLPASLEAALARGAEAFIATPRAQNPTGAAISAARAAALRAALVRSPDLLVIEDDHMGAVSGAPYATLLEHARARRVAIRSVSKALGPDLRVAVFAADPATAARVEGRQLVGVRWVSFVLQRLVAALLEADDVRAMLARAAATYAERRAAALEALAARGIAATGVSGHNIWIPVADEARTLQGLLDEGFAVAAGERFRIESPPAVRVTVADLGPGDASAFADAFARVLTPPRRTHGA